MLVWILLWVFTNNSNPNNSLKNCIQTQQWKQFCGAKLFVNSIVSITRFLSFEFTFLSSFFTKSVKKICGHSFHSAVWLRRSFQLIAYDFPLGVYINWIISIMFFAKSFYMYVRVVVFIVSDSNGWIKE